MEYTSVSTILLIGRVSPEELGLLMREKKERQKCFNHFSSVENKICQVIHYFVVICDLNLVSGYTRIAELVIHWV